MKQLAGKTNWHRPEGHRLGDGEAPAKRALELVCRRKRSRLDRENAGSSDWPSSEPCTTGADGRVLRSDPSVCGTCSKGEPLFRCCPKRCRQRSCVSEDWGVREALLRHRRVDKVGLRERGPSFPVFQWLEQYARFPREKYSSVEARFASRYHLGKISFLRAV